MNGRTDNSQAREIATELSIKTTNNVRDNNSSKNQKTFIDRSKLVSVGSRVELKRSVVRDMNPAATFDNLTTVIEK